MFRRRRPISRRNEEVMLATLRDTLVSLSTLNNSNALLNFHRKPPLSI